MRIIYGVAIFFVFPIVEVIFGLLGFDVENSYQRVCWECATHPNNENCGYYADDNSNIVDDNNDHPVIDNNKNVEHSKEEA